MNLSENVMNSFAPWVKCEERHSRHEDALSTPDGKCECLLESFIITGYLFVHWWNVECAGDQLDKLNMLRSGTQHTIPWHLPPSLTKIVFQLSSLTMCIIYTTPSLASLVSAYNWNAWRKWWPILMWELIICGSTFDCKTVSGGLLLSLWAKLSLKKQPVVPI